MWTGALLSFLSRTNRALWSRSGPLETGCGRTPHVRARCAAPPTGAGTSPTSERTPRPAESNPSRLSGSVRRRVDPPKGWHPSLGDRDRVAKRTWEQGRVRDRDGRAQPSDQSVRGLARDDVAPAQGGRREHEDAANASVVPHRWRTLGTRGARRRTRGAAAYRSPDGRGARARVGRKPPASNRGDGDERAAQLRADRQPRPAQRAALARRRTAAHLRIPPRQSNHSPWKRRHLGSSCEPDRPIFAVPRGSVGGVSILARFAFPPGRAPRPAVSWLGTSGALATSDDRCRRRVFPADCSRPRGRRVGYDECGGDAVASCSALSSLAIWSRVIASARDGRPRGSPPRAVAGGTTSNRARQPTTVN